MTVTAVVEPESLGIDAERLDELHARVRREIDDGLLPSCQFALARDGRLAAFESFGDAGPDSRYLIFSATKAFVASAAWLLIGEGSLDVDRPVADYIPEFASNGKDVVTVEQVMLHTSGFPRAPLGPPDWADRGRRLEAFARWRLNWEPGTAHEYHPTSAHWVLAELIERISGRDYRQFVHDRVTGALGLPRVLGIPPAEQDGIAELSLCGEPASPDELEAIFGVPELPVTEVTDDALLSFNRPDVRAVGVPGGGGVATAATVALFYQALLHNPDKLWDPDVLADATSRVRNTFPDLLALGAPANRALGVVVAGDDGNANRRGFGDTQSPRTFGDNGAGGQIAWADPESGLSFCYLTNGRDLNPIREARRGIGLSSRAAGCASWPRRNSAGFRDSVLTCQRGCWNLALVSGVGVKRITNSAMRQSPPPFPSMDDLSGDEDAILRFLRIQLLQQASHAQVADNNRYLRAEIQHNADVIRTALERLADRGYVERRIGRFARDEPTTYAYRLTEAGEEALRATE